MATTTATAIIDSAYIKVGIDAPTTAQDTTGFTALKNLFEFVGADNKMHVVTSESFSLTSAIAEYTVGPGGDFDTIRPVAVNSCYLRNSDNYDFPVTVMASKDYNRISYKSFDARPTKLYFLPEYPLAKVIFNHATTTSYTAYFEFFRNFTIIASTTATIGQALSMPEEYKEFLVYNLAIALGEDFDRKIPETVILKAERTRNVIDRLNASSRKVPLSRFRMEGMGGTGRSGYDITIDEYVG